MNRLLKACALLSLFPLLAPVALAQGGAAGPGQNDMAVIGNLGFANASDDDFDEFELLLSGAFEFYLDESVFLRGTLGFTEFEPDVGRGDVEFIFVNANIGYMWDLDRVEPFVTGGVGLYDKDAPLDDDVELGLNVGGGIDVSIQDQFAIRFEGLFHGFSGDKPDNFGSGTIGLKFVF